DCPGLILQVTLEPSHQRQAFKIADVSPFTMEHGSIGSLKNRWGNALRHRFYSAIRQRLSWVPPLALVLCSVTNDSAYAGETSPPPTITSPEVAKKPTFDKVGPQVGEQLPDLRL